MNKIFRVKKLNLYLKTVQRILKIRTLKFQKCSIESYFWGLDTTFFSDQDRFHFAISTISTFTMYTMFTIYT